MTIHFVPNDTLTITQLYSYIPSICLTLPHHGNFESILPLKEYTCSFCKRDFEIYTLKF